MMEEPFLFAYEKTGKSIQYFFYSQAFADGLRAAFAILLPACTGAYFGFFDIGLTISIGAMCVSLTDAPGPLLHRRNGMLFCSLFAFLTAVLTALCAIHPLLMLLEIIAVSFFFSMFNVYGNRAAAVGNAVMLVMILTMDKIFGFWEVLPHALFIFSGGMFYLGLSLLLHRLRPYRLAQRVLGDCIREIATYLSIKGDFYNIETDIDQDYRMLVMQQIIVNDKQDAVRELFFKTREIEEESTEEGRRLLFTFVETVDLFEDITASYYDYSQLRKEYSHTGALDLISRSLKKIAMELDQVGIAIQNNTTFVASFNYDQELQQIKSQMDLIAQKDQVKTLVLRKLLVNLRQLLKDLKDVVVYFNLQFNKNKNSIDHSQFVSHQSLDPKIFWDNISLKSSVFRHSLRVVIACVTGYLIARIIGYGHHSYWILLTVVFILKPAFSLTKQRNIERIMGTLAGGALGVFILIFIPNKTIQFMFMVLFMIGTYSFMRIRYLVMVICTTPYILILFSFLGTTYQSVAEERIFDTVLGGAISFSASYFLFPKWESEQLREFMHHIVKSNAVYLQKITEALSGQVVNMISYKLARKEVYLNSANLSAAFQRMLSEPKSKQKQEKEIHQFVVLNHILFSNTAMLTTTLLSKETRAYPEEMVHLAKKSVQLLNECAKKFGDTDDIPVPVTSPHHQEASALSNEDILLKEQLGFIKKISMDIDKTTTSLMH